jgi:small neutral amino acid transporter SnatA (MarC family)
MKLLMGGVVSAVLGLIGVVVWVKDFLDLIKGSLPLLLLVGGVLAAYIGIDDIQGRLREEREKQEEELAKAMEEIETIKARAEQYREELERLKEETDNKEGKL